MKEFESLKEGFFFHKNCILCQEPLHGFPKREKFNYCLAADLSININVNTEEVKLNHCTKETAIVPTTGTEYFCHYVTCVSCLRFYYSIQITFGWNSMQIEKTCLNSESFSIIKDGYIYSILNRYPVNITEYTCDIYDNEGDFSDVSSPSIKLPLININYNNPRNTVEKIKKLIVFR
jgi:hypothetical protein